MNSWLRNGGRDLNSKKWNRYAVSKWAAGGGLPSLIMSSLNSPGARFLSRSPKTIHPISILYWAQVFKSLFQNTWPPVSSICSSSNWNHNTSVGTRFLFSLSPLLLCFGNVILQCSATAMGRPIRLGISPRHTHNAPFPFLLFVFWFGRPVPNFYGLVNITLKAVIPQPYTFSVP